MIDRFDMLLPTSATLVDFFRAVDSCKSSYNPNKHTTVSETRDHRSCASHRVVEKIRVPARHAVAIPRACPIWLQHFSVTRVSPPAILVSHVFVDLIAITFAEYQLTLPEGFFEFVVFRRFHRSNYTVHALDQLQ